MPAGISESEYKQRSEELLRQIRSTKIEGLEADLLREQWVTKRKKVEVEIAQEQHQHAQIKLQIEQVKTVILRNNLKEAEVNRSISEVKLQGAKDRLTFEEQNQKSMRDLFTQKLRALDLTVGAETFENDDRRRDYNMREISVGLPKSYPFSSREAAAVNN